MIKKTTSALKVDFLFFIFASLMWSPVGLKKVHMNKFLQCIFIADLFAMHFLGKFISALSYCKIICNAFLEIIFSFFRFSDKLVLNTSSPEDRQRETLNREFLKICFIIILFYTCYIL